MNTKCRKMLKINYRPLFFIFRDYNMFGTKIENTMTDPKRKLFSGLYPKF